jgi:hypothetical protein
MTGSKCRAQAQFSGKHGGGDNTCELTSIVTRVGVVRAAYTKQVKHSTLSFKDRTTANSSNLN